MRLFLHHKLYSYVRIFAVLLLLCPVSKIAAQTCSGTWGAPTIKQTFGQGTPGTQYFTPLSAYAPGVTTSTTLITSQPSDGYSILTQNSVNGQSGGTWINKKDHTGDAEGLMFLINAPSTAATVFVEYTMRGLCPNTVLQFSVWILNVNDPSLTSNSTYQYPNMRINLVDANTGAAIANTSTGNVPADKNWHNYTIVFNNAASTDVKMQLVNNSVGSGYGNDLALDDITVSPCVPVTHILPKLDTTICQASTFSFNASVSGNVYTTPEYLWQYSTDSGKTWVPLGSASTVPTASYTPPNVPGSYWVRFLTGPMGMSLNSNCSAVSDTTKIVISKKFTMPSMPDTSVCINNSIQLNAKGAATYSWSPSTGLSCSNCANPTATLAQTTMYKIVGTDINKCMDSISMTVAVQTPMLTADNVCPGIRGNAAADVINASSATYAWYDEGDPVKSTISSTGDTLNNLTIGRNYLVNISTNVCDTTIPFIIEKYEAPVAEFTIDPILCVGQAQPIVNQSSAYSSLTWDMGNGDQLTGEAPVYNYTVTGDYLMSLIARNEHCADTATHTVSVREFHLQLIANADSVVSGQPIELQTSGSDEYTVSIWNPAELFPDQTAKSQSIPADESRKYTVWAASKDGCVDSASAYVGVKSFSFIASAFTPNGDGKNDYFRPVIVGSNPWTLSVYNRWGKTVFEGKSSAVSNGWDGTINGTPADMGVYFYAIEIVTDNGVKQYKGEVTLFR